MRLARTTEGAVLERDDETLLLDEGWDELFGREALGAHLATCGGTRLDGEISPTKPIGSQEVWAAGITYYASRDARMEESADAGNADVYQRCYDAVRPELFFKATAHRVAGPDQAVRIRHDSQWNVPEPELVLAITRHGEVFGYTIGNDMSSRDIEGENPLYLPQAKLYDGCAALGPSITVSDSPPLPETRIAVTVDRATETPDGRNVGRDTVFAGETTVSRIRRTFDELVEHLWRDNTFPAGCFLMTGTGVVPPPDFTLRHGDTITITIDGIGMLRNHVVQSGTSIS